MTSFSIFPLAPKGFGFGDPAASISVAKRLEQGVLTPEIMQVGAYLLLSGEYIVDIVHQDSGCIDGRLTTQISFRGIDHKLHTNDFNPDNHFRALVAGGGAITARMAEVALFGRGHTAPDDLRRATLHLQQKHIYPGAHVGLTTNSAQHTTDCGANDKFVAIVATALKYQAEIKAVLLDFYTVKDKIIPDFDDLFERVMVCYQQLTEPSYTAGYNGQQALEVIKESLSIDENGRPRAVIKRLAGEHKEAFIFINTIPSSTLNQAGFTKALSQHFADRQFSEVVQVFVVDEWYIEHLAKTLAQNERQREVAFMAMMIYQIATAATLTDGTLPVYLAKQH